MNQKQKIKAILGMIPFEEGNHYYLCEGCNSIFSSPNEIDSDFALCENGCSNHELIGLGDSLDRVADILEEYLDNGHEDIVVSTVTEKAVQVEFIENM